MFLGRAARCPTAVPIGRFSHSGASSVRKNAIPKASGTEIISANTAVTTVP